MQSPTGIAAARRRTVTMDHVWVAVAMAVPVIGVLAGAMSSIDLAYQIRAGEWMLRTHRLLDVDTFTFTAAGTHWLNQQWGAQVLIALIHRAGRFGALSVTRGALTFLGFGGVYLACREAGASLRRAALLSLAAFGLSLYHLAMRPQMFGVALFGLALWVVEGRRRRPGLLWASIHGSFVLGPLLGGLAWLEDRRDRLPVARTTLTVTVVAGMASLVNPFGLRVWTYAIGIGTNPTIRNLISEWRPTTARTAAGAAFLASVAILAVYFARRERQVPWLVLLRLGIFFVLGLPAIRGVLWWGMATPVIAAELLPPSGGREPRVGVPAMNVAIVVAVCLAVVVAAPRGSQTVLGTPILEDAPAGLSATAQEELPTGSRLFNSQLWGSWFELTDPTMQVFVDSLIEVTSATVWNDYFRASSAQDGWQGILDRWRVDAAVLSPEQAASLIQSMLVDPGWRVLRHDTDGYLFVRR